MSVSFSGVSAYKGAGAVAQANATKQIAFGQVRFGADPEPEPKAADKAAELPKGTYQTKRITIKIKDGDPEAGQLRWEQLFTLTRTIKGMFDVSSDATKVPDAEKPKASVLGLDLEIGGRENYTAKELRENSLNGWISGWIPAAMEAGAVFYYKAKHAIFNAGGFWSGISKVGEMLFGSPKDEPKPAAT